jgi:hypothetical protein
MKTIQELANELIEEHFKDGTEKLSQTASLLDIQLEVDPNPCTVDDLFLKPKEL